MGWSRAWTGISSPPTYPPSTFLGIYFWDEYEINNKSDYDVIVHPAPQDYPPWELPNGYIKIVALTYENVIQYPQHGQYAQRWYWDPNEQDAAHFQTNVFTANHFEQENRGDGLIAAANRDWFGIPRVDDYFTDPLDWEIFLNLKVTRLPGFGDNDLTVYDRDDLYGAHYGYPYGNIQTGIIWGGFSNAEQLNHILQGIPVIPEEFWESLSSSSRSSSSTSSVSSSESVSSSSSSRSSSLSSSSSSRSSSSSSSNSSSSSFSCQISQSDDFDGSDGDPPDPLRWEQIFHDPVGIDILPTIQSNKLNWFSNSTTDVTYGHIRSRSGFSGDLDFRIDFDIATMTIPSGSSSSLGMMLVKESDNDFLGYVLRSKTGEHDPEDG